jgi:multidrug efflux system membrane fusion protein
MTHSSLGALRRCVPAAAVLWTVLATAFVAGCTRSGAEPVAEPAARPVIAETVAPNARSRTERYSGDVHARYEAPLAFRIDGKISARKAGIGDRVVAGQVLATLDPADAAMNAAGARAAVSAAASQRDLGRRQRDRIAALRERALVSQAQLDQADDALKAAEAALLQARQQLGVRENQVRYATLVAEHDGVITTQDAEADEVVAAGQRVFGLAWSDEREVHIAVPESRIDALRGARSLDVTLWARPDHHYAGSLRELSAAADPQSRTFLAKIAIEGADAAVQLQMSADVAVASPPSSGTYVLPATALFHSGDRTAVWIVEPGDRLALREVAVARYVDDGVAIADGLATGERVVTRGVHTLHAGEPVRVVDLPFAPADGRR